MKINIAIKFIIAVCVIMTAPRPRLLSEPSGRFLVLGFDSRQINDVQDTLLREAVMRHLHTVGYRIVPVMDIESLFHGGRKRQIRKLKREDIHGLCKELAAGSACCGSIVPDDGKPDDKIHDGKSYICSLTLYRGDTNAFHDLTFTVTGDANLYRFYEILSKRIAEEIRKVL
jgi:hypothetical protein